ncbi:poly-gamma-glutamate hydrolase family protein [Staphylococcus auricularis]|uniref:poly-gamma-glutamate hydrolase family protein n=1 Tax=Staphylococcus auricularis TaxID=29379 RepID=UPI00242FB4C1|nr:poly-gamma-glutamate hydrolase family protein [Staphylococcus auricularis]
MSDLYHSMSELERKEDDYMFEFQDRHSKNLITAVHGGGIEAGTSELAQCIADKAAANYFSFKGTKPENNFDLHVTSTNYDNPTLLNWSQKMKHIIAVHGVKGKQPMTYVGGRDKQLVSSVIQHLEGNGFKAEVAPKKIACKDPNNITNKNARGQGVQLEISNQQRKMLFKNNDFSRSVREQSINWSDDMYLYADSICRALETRDQNE